MSGGDRASAGSGAGERSGGFEPLGAQDHRADREAGSIVYPVISRRSRGLSVGVNLFPDRKLCSFDCPYCEVFPFSHPIAFSLESMERGLRTQIAAASTTGIEVKDICFSGNGEPTLSPSFEPALTLAARLRDELCPSASLVLITNGSTLGRPAVADFLATAAQIRGMALDIWLKFDAGTPSWYQKIDCGRLSHVELLAGIEGFVSRAPVTIQTMLCSIDGKSPPEAERRAWEAEILRLAALSRSDRDCLVSGLVRIQLYGKARPAPEDPLAQELPLSYLEKRAATLSAALERAGYQVPIEVFP